MISLTFDDALDQHLDTVIELLDRYELPGTFYAHLSADSFFQRRDEWRAAAERGHEIGGHTVFHPADHRKNWVSHGNAIDYYSPDRMRLELQLANRYLSSVDGCNDRTFAYPCSNPVIGDYGLLCRSLFRIGLRNTRIPGMVERSRLDFGNTRFEYSPIVAKQYFAARSGGLHLDMASPSVDGLDRYHLPSAAVNEHSFIQMRHFIERSLEAGGWPILQFHGIGGGHHMDCDRTEFEKLVTWLGHHHRELVATVFSVSRSLFSS